MGPWQDTRPAVAALVACQIAIAACSGKEADVPATAAKLAVTSPAFASGAAIPDLHTCKGKDLSPALSFTGAPGATKSFVLICDDPDAPMGTWVHWVAYGIPGTTAALPQGVPPGEAIAGGGKQGKNSWGRLGYGGPCPPSGTHRYFFKLYALDVDLPLPPNATKAEAIAAMEGHVVGAGELMGTCTKK